ncbi:hypothetical protein StrepF001_34150 [Streptomyces sp. F001]|uniref:hypothetical protein n=1 Tax=Streptomyces sp. F001 TaxID=1510026 RepID=UPI00101E862F|nr:hypothetical protein [Streptomyces sp. F001]RZB15206.1 hypothetical protein StrepF001_34150 [Streptomyces sp. F001]
MPDMSASASLAMTHLVTLAKEVDEDKVTPGVLGFIVFAVMALAVWGLMKSMNRHMGRVDFDEAPDGAGEASGKGAAEQTSGKASPAKG